MLDVSRSRYYSWLRNPFSDNGLSNAELLKKIEKIYTDSRNTYGIPRITASLRVSGNLVNHKRMRENNLKAKMKMRFKVTTDSNHNNPISENILNREFKASKPDQKWVSDITYISTLQGWLYLCIVIDLYSRKVVGWSMDDNMKTELVSNALTMAIRNRKPDSGVIFHSDRGSQYASTEFRSLLEKHGFVQSMSRKGNCWDNAVAESFFIL